MQLHFVSFIGLAPGVEKQQKRYGQANKLPIRQNALHDSALTNGDVDVTHSWTRERLQKTDYYKDNQTLLDQPQGCGYWAWKPYIILQTLAQTKADDYVIYCDVGRPSENAQRDHGNIITTSLRPLVEWAERHNGMLPGVYLSNHGPAKHWIKRDCFSVMNCDEERYHNNPTVQAGYTVWKNTPDVIEFLKAWQQANLDIRLISDQENTLGLDNDEGFVRHCHDQATLTLLCEKRGVTVFGDRKHQFWGFRNINYIAHEAAHQNARQSNTLTLNRLNIDSKLFPNYLVRWFELLTLNRVQHKLNIALLGEVNEAQKATLQTYLPSADITVVSLNRLTDHPNKILYDVIIARDCNDCDFSENNLAILYLSLREEGFMLIRPLPDVTSELERVARSISSNGSFRELDGFAKLQADKFSPKIPNSRNPIFVSGRGVDEGLEKTCLMIKPSAITNGVSDEC